jgi:hypothetical protein
MNSLNDSPHTFYIRAVEEADRRFDAEIASVRGKQDAGELTARESADERIRIMTAHLETVRELRRRYLGST